MYFWIVVVIVVLIIIVLTVLWCVSVSQLQKQTSIVDIVKPMNQLWTVEASLTRMFITGITDGSSGVTATASALGANANNIGNNFAMYYGKDAGNTYSILLKQNSVLVGEITNTLMSGGNADPMISLLNVNSGQLTNLVASNIKSIDKNRLLLLFNSYNQNTLNEITSTVAGDYTASFAAFSKILATVDALTSYIGLSIAKQ